MIQTITKPAIRLIVQALREAKPLADTDEAKARHQQALAYAENILASMAEPKGVN